MCQPLNPSARASAATAMPVMTATNSLRRTTVIATAAATARITTVPPLITTGSAAATMTVGQRVEHARPRGVIST